MKRKKLAKHLSLATFAVILVVAGGLLGMQWYHQPFHYTWQKRCDSACAQTLGRREMQKFDVMNCANLAKAKSLYTIFAPGDTQNYTERMAAIQDLIEFEKCPR
jgi:hypothetical protein